jgi:hypothetical protein
MLNFAHDAETSIAVGIQSKTLRILTRILIDLGIMRIVAEVTAINCLALFDEEARHLCALVEMLRSSSNLEFFALI